MAKATKKVVHAEKAEETEIEHIKAGNMSPVIEDGGMHDKVKITIPVGIELKRVYMGAGSHIVERHQVETILEMVHKKQKADLQVFTGSNYMVERMVDRSLRVTQVESLDRKTLVGR